MPYSGAVAWVGQRRFVALMPYSAGSRLTLWSYDYDAMDGGRAERPSLPLDTCAVRVDDAVTALGADGGATGAAWFSVFTPAACEGLPAGASLVRVEGSQVTKFPDAGLGGSSLRLASRNLHVWLASEAVGGGFELRSFDVSGDTAVSDFERPLGLTHPGDWTQVDVTADGQGRPYVVGNSNAGVRVASFELDGGERFVLPVPATVGVRAVAAAWTSRGLAIAGDCDGADSGVCAPDAGNFLVLVRVPR